MARAQCVLAGVRPSVRQSSNTVWSKVPGRTAALNSRTVRSSAAASSLNAAASSPSDCARTGGNTGGMNLPMDLASMIE
jgi:hypothetical protein